MSSSPKKPYQSKLLNLINRYYIKLNSSLGVRVRELGYNLQGSLQKLVLPFWKIWQLTTKRAKVGASSSDYYNLPQANRDNKSEQTYHRADYLIESVNHNLSKHPLYTSLLPPNFTGLASRLKEKELVMVVNLNEVEDLDEKIDRDYLQFTIDYTLENPQQAGLRNNLIDNYLTKIKNLLPTFKQRQKEANIELELTEHNSPSPQKRTDNQNYLTFLTGKKNIDLPKKPLKGSEILLAIESEIDIQQQNEGINNVNPSPRQKLLSASEKARFSLPPIKNQLVKDVITTSNAKIQAVLPIIGKNTSRLVAKGIDRIQLTTRHLNKSIDEDPFQIKVLIIEALNYFFSQQQNQPSKQLDSSSNHPSLPKITQTKTTVIKEEVNKPWLSWCDLYGEQKPLPLENTEDTSKQTISISEAKKIEDIADDKVPISTCENKVSSTPVTNKIMTIEHKSETIVKKKAYSTLKSNNLNVTESISLTSIKEEKSQVIGSKNNGNLEEKINDRVTIETDNKVSQNPEAIEVKVVEIKYEKHLLEIVLEKLDRAILWLEETLIKLVAIIKILINNIAEKQ